MKTRIQNKNSKEVKKLRKSKSNIQSASIQSPVILGTYEGECADANITNKNGLDITREVWENVFNSDEYKEAIDKGWYIGYLGHPEDPGCQDFQNACIVMTEGHIEDTGKVYGKFNLIDTPVGRIVKAFQDAGVTFGISVRGAGDIVNNSVDPDTFIFRGFDLVAFPAYPEAIPKFSQIAASLDIDSVKKYKTVCTALNDNLGMINSATTLSCIQSQFAKNSDLYKAVEQKKESLKDSKKEVESCDNNSTDTMMIKQRLEAMTELYIDAAKKSKSLSVENRALKQQLREVQSTDKKKLIRMREITSAQLADISRASENKSKQLQAKINSTSRINKQLKNQIVQSSDEIDEHKSKINAQSSRINAQNSQIDKYKDTIEEQISTIKDQRNEIRASRVESEQSDRKIQELNTTIQNLQRKLKICSDENLEYKQKLQKSSSEIKNLQNQLSVVEADNRKTLSELNKMKTETSELDAVIARNEELEDLIAEYQGAYAGLYANALGVSISNINASAQTSVKDIQRIVASQISRSYEPTYDETPNIDGYQFGDVDNLDELITL